VILDLRDQARFEAEGSQEAVAAFRRVAQLAERWKEDFQLNSGDMVIFHNKRAAHRWAELKDAAVRVAHGSRGTEQWQERVIK
ncbi:unnamed protein product, partial [Effrenium voratum]